MSLNRNDYILKNILPEINWFINTVENPENPDNNFPDKFTIDDDVEDILRGYRRARNEFAHNNMKYVIPEEFIYEQKLFNIDKFIPILKGDTEENYSSVVKSLFKSESLLTYKGKSLFYNDSFKSLVSCETTEDHYDTLMERGFNLKETKNIQFDDLDKNYIYSSQGSLDWLNEVFYIDSISLFDLSFYLNNVLKDDNNRVEYKEHIVQLLDKLDEKWDANEEIDEKISIVAKEFKKSFKNYYSNIDEILDNYRSYYGDMVYIFYLDQINANISSGIQQIEIVERLLNSKKLVPGTFLIFDEPEVNLHPEWQFQFAKILVLLAKELDVTIYINSHSPTFIESIDAFAEFYDMEEDIKYYLTEESETDGKYNFTNIDSSELYKIYSNLGNVYDEINKLRLRKKLNR